MAVICPTVTATDPHEYRAQMERLKPFAERVHVDLMDGQFAPTVSPPLEQIWLPHEFDCDVHLMYQKPGDFLQILLRLQPHMVIIHAEAEVNHRVFAAELEKAGIKAGLALLQQTDVSAVEDIIHAFDHILVFSGHLGYHGGELDRGMIGKVSEIKAIHPEVEVSWDGGISDKNAKWLSQNGVEVLNVGGFIQKSDAPEAAYATLKALVG